MGLDGPPVPISLVLSLDGRRETNDAMRPDVGGHGTYERIVENFRRCLASRAVSTGHRILQRLGWKPDGDQAVGALSGGTRQKIHLALA
ncbi:MAG: hypothetical protein ACFNLW_08790, partial [Olsenella sp.]